MLEGLIKKGQTYIVGVSGGADSMALLDLVRRQGIKVIVAHVNYNLREDTQEDYDVVHNYCMHYGIPFAYKEVVHEEHSGNFQAEAREIRYNFYKELYVKYHASGVILGHHYDDHVETIYMYFQRGSQSDYIGIAPKSIVKGMVILRPLLDMRKQELREYCHEHAIKFHDDYTNFMTDFERDRVRNTILNHYSDEDKQALVLKAEEMNQKIAQEMIVIDQLLENYHQRGFLLLSELPEDATRFFFHFFNEKIDAKKISQHLIKEALHQLHSEQPNIAFALPEGYQLVKAYDRFWLEKQEAQEDYSYQREDESLFDCPYFKVQKEGPKNNGIRPKREDYPLTIRNIRKGDKIHTKGGTKKVSRLFIDRKIPAEKRKKWPIVLNKDQEILLVPALAKHKDYLEDEPAIYIIPL